VSATTTKAFTLSDHQDLEKVDGWWAGLLRKGPKEITGLEWVSNGDLVWILKLTWSRLDIDSLPFNVCMPAYAGLTVSDLEEMLEVITSERSAIMSNLKLFKNKLDDWEVLEVDTHNPEYDEYNETNIMDFGIDPNLSYASKLDVVEKIMASEFLWPCYKAMRRAHLMCEARIEELKKEIHHRGDPTYTVVHVDRGMLRSSFTEQMGYDNKWLFATDEEIFEDYKDQNEESDPED
jgi:hypothetical protein